MGPTTRGHRYSDSLVSQTLERNCHCLQQNHEYLSAIQHTYFCAIYDVSCTRILLFHTSPVPNFYGEFSEQVIYHCHLLQIQLSPFHIQLYIILPWLISHCHNLSLSNSQLGHIFNAFHISSLKLSCFHCTDNQHNLAQQDLQHLPL